MKKKNIKSKLIIKKCHLCGAIMEAFSEIKRCSTCKKPFLPLNYFSIVHSKDSKKSKELFLDSEDLSEEDMIKGINVLW